MKTERYLDWHLVAGLIGAGLVMLAMAFVGLHYLFLTSTLDTLAWILSGALIALPALVGFAFYLGKIEARGALTAMETTMRTAVQGFAPSQVAGVKAMNLMEQAVERRMNERMAREYLGGLSEAIPQLSSGNGARRVQGEVVDQGEVSM